MKRNWLLIGLFFLKILRTSITAPPHALEFSSQRRTSLERLAVARDAGRYRVRVAAMHTANGRLRRRVEFYAASADDAAHILNALLLIDDETVVQPDALLRLSRKRRLPPTLAEIQASGNVTDAAVAGLKFTAAFVRAYSGEPQNLSSITIEKFVRPALSSSGRRDEEERDFVLRTLLSTRGISVRRIGWSPGAFALNAVLRDLPKIVPSTLLKITQRCLD